MCSCWEACAISTEPKGRENDNLLTTTDLAKRQEKTRISQPPPPAARSITEDETSLASSTDASVKIGDIIDGKYEVNEIIGRGGMGMVLAATHLELEQKVALKFMSPDIMEIPGAVARFRREARAAAKLKSSHVCRVLDIGETSEGAKYIVIEYLEGNDLNDELKARGSLPAEEASLYLQQACEALGEAHSLDIVHRDIKPANLFLDRKREGRSVLKVLDFGISKSLARDPDTVVTATNALMGSPVYMSPEQLLTPKEVDTRADIWSLGIVLHELLTGVPVFQAATLPEVIALIVNDRKPPESLIDPAIAPALRQVIAKCLRRDPVMRYRTAEELANALDEALGQMPRRTQAVASEVFQDRSDDNASKWLRGGAAFAFVLGAILLFVFWPQGRGEGAKSAPGLPSAAPSIDNLTPTLEGTSKAAAPRPGSKVDDRANASLHEGDESSGNADEGPKEATILEEASVSASASEPQRQERDSAGTSKHKRRSKRSRASSAQREGKAKKAGNAKNATKKKPLGDLMDPTDSAERGNRPNADSDMMAPE